MQAVIMAAGKGTRLAPLTEVRPKPLLRVANKTILEHNLDQLVGISDHVFIVVNHFKEQVIAQIGQEYKGMRITFVDQEKPLGTGDAIKSALPFLDKKFIVMNGDDVYFREGIEKVVKKSPCLLLKEVKNPESFGVVTVSGTKVSGIIEKPDKPISNLVNMGVYFLEKDIFSIALQPSERGEYELVDYLKPLIQAGKLNFEVAENWFPITYPWSLLDANAFLLEQLNKPTDKMLEKEEKIKGIVEENCNLKENVWIGEGTIIKSGTYIEKNVMIGKNCIIGPNCFIRSGTTIGNSCHVGQAVELKNTIIFDKSNVPHLSYVGDSVIGSGSNLGAGTITANLRHDGANVKSEVKGVLIDTGRRKLGAIIGDNVKTGIGTMIYPGRKLWPGARTIPQENIKEDRK